MIHRPCSRTRARAFLLTTVAIAALSASAAARAEAPPENSEPALDSIRWVAGPSTGALGGVAELKVPAEYVFTGAEGTQKLMALMHNPTSGRELGLIRPKNENWFVLFEFQDIGYVKDDDKDKLDAAAMLASIQEGNEASNEERRKNGWGTLEIVGWEHPPRYDPTSNNLEWALRARDSAGAYVINYNTRLLGREGVMEVALVCGPEELPAILPQFRALLSGYGFTPGHKYAEWRAGDKVAQYGLAALVTGSAVAVAAKAGILAKLGKGAFKLIAVGLVAVGAFLKKLFGKGSQA